MGKGDPKYEDQLRSVEAEKLQQLRKVQGSSAVHVFVLLGFSPWACVRICQGLCAPLAGCYIIELL